MIWRIICHIRLRLLFVGRMNKESAIILDACTILNLLRIDDDADFLLRQIKKLKLFLPETVVKESKMHCRSPLYSQEKNDQMGIAVYSGISQFLVLDSEIKNDMGQEEYERLLSFANHNKRENGELWSVALALIKSRIEGTDVCFYTDDYKAIDEFWPYYRHHCIGYIGDTLDFLTTIYWQIPEGEFQKGLYLSFLNKLKVEYNQQLNGICREVKKLLNVLRVKGSNDKDQIKYLEMIVDGYYMPDMELLNKGVKFFQEGTKYKDIKKIVGDFDTDSASKQLKRINKHLALLKNYPTFKLA